MDTNVNNTLELRVDEETCIELERIGTDIDRTVDNIARLVSTNSPWTGSGLQDLFSELKEFAAAYDEKKKNVTDKYVYPASKERWGEHAKTSWTLKFGIQLLVVKLSSTRPIASISSEPGIVPKELCEEQRKLSVSRAACQYLYDRLVGGEVEKDIQTYQEFKAFYDEVQQGYYQNLNKITKEYVNPWCNTQEAAGTLPKGTESTRTWDLTFDDGHVVVTYDKR